MSGPERIDMGVKYRGEFEVANEIGVGQQNGSVYVFFYDADRLAFALMPLSPEQARGFAQSLWEQAAKAEEMFGLRAGTA